MPRFALSWLKHGTITFTVALFEFALNAAPQGAELGQILEKVFKEKQKTAFNENRAH